MNVMDQFPSKFLKAADLGESQPIVTIDKVSFEQVGQGAHQELKAIIHFVGKSKGMVCNKTNANMIAKIAGSRDTDDWGGVKIKLVVAEVEFQGQPVEAIRVRDPKVAKPKPAPAPPVREPGDDDIAPDDSDIGF